MPQKVHKLILSTQDKLNHESHSDCLIHLHAPINNATGFRVCSSHIPVDAGTFTFYENSMEYQLSSNYTFPNIKKIHRGKILVSQKFNLKINREVNLNFKPSDILYLYITLFFFK